MPRPLLNIPKPDVGLFDGEQGWAARQWYAYWDELFKRVPVTGSVTFASATTATITLSTPELTNEYTVLVEAPEDRRVWITSKGTTSFIMNVSAASSATYNWTLTRQ